MQQDPVVCPWGWGPRANFLGSLRWLSPWFAFLRGAAICAPTAAMPSGQWTGR